jgi:DNA-binding GntR family transcriptional regulator
MLDSHYEIISPSVIDEIEMDAVNSDVLHVMKTIKRLFNQSDSGEFSTQPIRLILPNKKELANRFQCPMSSVTKALIELEEQGYVSKYKGSTSPVLVINELSQQSLLKEYKVPKLMNFLDKRVS